VLQRLADQVAVAIVNARLFEEVTEATRAWTSTFDSIGVGLAIVDDSGRIVRYNGRARQLAAGAGRGELAGLPFYEAILGTTAEPNDRPVERALRDGVMVRTVLDVPGAPRRLQVTAAPHLDRGVIVTFDWAGDPVNDGSAQPRPMTE
jgi:GAF domain-containing protein